MATTTPGGPAPEIRYTMDAVARVSKALYLVPAIAAVIALSTPIANLRLTDEPLTLTGMAEHFSDLESAAGVRPIVVLLLGCLWVLLIGGIAVALAGSTAERPVPGWVGAVLVTCGIILMLLALPAAGVIDSADHVANTVRRPPFEPRFGGVGMLMLTGFLTAVVARIDYQVRS